MLIVCALPILPSDPTNPQSFEFLLDVAEFKKSTMNQDGKDDFEEFLAIVNEYIKNSSDSEINIDHRMKNKILKFSERSAYIALDTVCARVCLQEAYRRNKGMIAFD